MPTNIRSKSSTPIVGYNPIYDMVSNSNKTFTSKLLNWVEPYEIEGYNKTLFYTEVNTELKVGDKVFIINGVYDSNVLIQNNKYKKGRDGYKVLLIDKCKVVLDIDYNGVLPYLTSNDDNFIKIYHISDIKGFVQANRQITTKDGSFEHSFSYYKNNIAYIDNDYLYNKNWGYSSVSGTPGFFVKNSNTWTNITSDILSGSYSYSLSNSIPNVDRIKIMNSDFTHNGKTFKEGYIYKWDSSKSDWVIDISYIKPYLSKNNFRDGSFNGEWNSGLYGQYNKNINWTGSGIWNTGVLINTTWQSGYMNSLHKPLDSYFSDFDSYGIPYQKLNSKNNSDRGYNFIYDSLIENSNIKNGTFYKTKFGDSTFTQSVVENEILNYNINYLVNIENGFFKNCEFLNSNIQNSELKKTISNNSKFENVKITNSYLNNSVLKNSSYNSDSIIKIYSYDELTASEYLSIGNTYSYRNDIDHKVFKFYIDKDGYERLKNGDYFYMKGISINNNSNDIINFFDKKFKITAYTEYTEENFGIKINGKRGYEYVVFLSTPLDNSYLFESSIGDFSGYSKYYTKIGDANPNSKYYSVDIWVSRYDIENTLTSENIDFNRNIIDIKNAYIIDSDYNSGLIINSDWNSGYHIESNNDNNITIPSLSGGYYNLSIDSNSYILATTSYNSDYPEYEKIDVGDVVFLNCVDFNDNSDIYRLPNSYKVISNDNNIYKLMEIGTSEIISLSASNGFYYTNKSENRYNHLSKLKIYKTKIKSGIFKRSYISNSLIHDLDFDYTDKDLKNKNNLKNLIISDSIFYNNSNILSNALYLNSFFINGSDTWISGIIQNSIWNGGTFSTGVIRDTRWIDGLFENGYFYNSNTFNGGSTSDILNFYSENINSYYKNGTLPNNRNSWQNGYFLNGEFNKSDWEFGTFSYGKFYNSKWYDGIFQNGTIGDIKLSYYDTYFYNGTISYANVENASIYANDTSYIGNIQQNINWIDGVFNNGIFGSNINSNSIWNNGIFNSGQFISNAKWKNGTFNNGKFISSYGWTQSDSLYNYDYSWENGTFNNGEFGNANGLTNSTWHSGDFNGGVFKGRVWNNGVFLYGEFQGSGQNPIGGLTCANANVFVDSFTNSYWGKWRDGLFTDTKDKFIKDKKIYTDLVKSSSLENMNYKRSIFKNGLWISGTFSHQNGQMLDSVWLDGVFENGSFENSSFNPYVKRNGSTSSSFNLNDSTCYWKNGNFNNSDFYISHWKNGNFIIGTATGMIWENGTSLYMNAINVFWENGIWKNGNWYGSSFEFDGEIIDDYTFNIIKRGIEWLGTSSCHIWNIFSLPIGQETVLSSVESSSIGSNGWVSTYHDGTVSMNNDDVEDEESEQENQT